MPIAVSEYRKAKAVELALAGATYDQIAREVGYANRGTAHRTVTKALAERVDEAVDEYRRVELDRLDALQASLWDRAMEGDIASASTILKIIEKRIRLLGLEHQVVEGASPRTVVLHPADFVSGDA